MKSHLINVPDYYCYNTTLVSEYCIAMPAVWDGKGSSNCLLLTTGVAIYHNICTSPFVPSHSMHYCSIYTCSVWQVKLLASRQYLCQII